MHFSLMLLILAIAWGIRGFWSPLVLPDSPSSSRETWFDRWQRALMAFLLPPLLLLSTAIAILSMGHEGRMLDLPVGWGGCALALSFLGFAVVLWLWRVGQGWRAVQQTQTYPQITLNGTVGRILDTPALFAAQVGLWRSTLVVSRGLLNTLNTEQLEAVLAHEQAHLHYRDTFWFFWLGWIRHLTAWLPQTEPLWQELLLLRELRADRWAAQRVDALLLAESLLLVVRSSLSPAHSPEYSVALGAASTVERLEERIEALLAEPLPSYTHQPWRWIGLGAGFVPFLTVLLHT